MIRPAVVIAGVVALQLPQPARQLEAQPFGPRKMICYHAAAPLNIDGRLDEASWQNASWSEPFVDIEGDSRPRPSLATRMKMLWDDTYLYIGADLQEPHLWGTLTRRDSVIYKDNDFEVFIDPDGDTHEYYELEINALNTVWDLMLIRPYRDGGPAIDAWDIAGLKTGVHLRGTLNRPADRDDGWSIEIAMPWKVLAEAAPGVRAPRDGEQWRVNFSRVQWQLDIKDGTYLKRVNADGTLMPEHNWVWSPQGAVAMHMPERWGYVQFSSAAAGGHATFSDHVDEPVKWLLRRWYYRQADYRASHGRYARTTAQLGTGDLKLEGLQLHATDDLYVLTAPAPSGGVMTLRQDGRVWKAGPVARIPFPWPAVGQIEVPVSINGEAPLTFLVDTGAEYSIISTAVAERLGISKARQGIRDFANGVSLSFGGISLRNQRVMVMPFDGYRRQGRAIEGIIGYDFFDRYVVSIDFERKTMTVWEAGPFQHSERAIRVPLEFVRRLPVVPVSIDFPGRVNLQTRLVLDTGASQTVMLRHPFAVANRLLGLAAAGETHTASSLASGDLRLVRLPANHLRFASRTFDQPFIRAHREPVGSGAYTETDGVLGNELLRRFLVVVDYSRRLMTLEPNGSVSEPFKR